MKGSVHDGALLRPELLRLQYAVGNRPGHYRAFMSLIEHFPDWDKLPAHYPRIGVPVLLIYSRHDWSTDDEREANRAAIPGAELATVEDAGHLLSLDAPLEAVRLIRGFALKAPAATA